MLSRPQQCGIASFPLQTERSQGIRLITTHFTCPSGEDVFLSLGRSHSSVAGTLREAHASVGGMAPEMLGAGPVLRQSLPCPTSFLCIQPEIPVQGARTAVRALRPHWVVFLPCSCGGADSRLLASLLRGVTKEDIPFTHLHKLPTLGSLPVIWPPSVTCSKPAGCE